MKKDLVVFIYYSHKRISVFNQRVSVLYFATNVKSRFPVKTENFDTEFLLCRNHIFGMAFKGICIYIFEKLAISDENYTYKHTLSTTTTKIVNAPLMWGMGRGMGCRAIIRM